MPNVPSIQDRAHRPVQRIFTLSHCEHLSRQVETAGQKGS